MNFLAIPREKNGAYYDRTTDPEHLRWLRMFSQFGREGLLANDIFIDKRVQMEGKSPRGAALACSVSARTWPRSRRRSARADPQKSYIAVDGPRNAAGAAVNPFAPKENPRRKAEPPAAGFCRFVRQRRRAAALSDNSL